MNQQQSIEAPGKVRRTMSKMPAENESQPFKVTELLHVWRRWWLVTTLGGILLAVASIAGIVYLSPPVYRASALLQVDARRQHLVYQSDGDILYQDRFMPTQIGLIRSPVILEPVVSDLQVSSPASLERQDNPIQWLEDGLGVEQLGQSELLRVTFDSNQGEVAKTVVESVVRAYGEFHASSNNDRAAQMISRLDEELSKQFQEVEQLRSRIKSLVQKHPRVLEINREPVGNANPLSNLQIQLASAEVEQRVLGAKLAAERNALAADQVPVTEGMIAAAIDNHPSMISARNLVTQKQAALTQAQAVASNSIPSTVVKQLESELQTHQKLVDTIRDQLRGVVVENLKSQVRSDIAGQIKLAELELQRAASLETSLKQQIAEQDKPTGGGEGEAFLEYRYLQAEEARAELVHKQISDRIDEMETESRAPARIAVLMKAKVPDEPHKSASMARLGAVALFAFCLPFALAVFFERGRRPVRDARQIERDCDISVVGEVTYYPARQRSSRQRIASGEDRRRQVFDECIDAMRTRLLLSEPLEHMQVLAVASAVSGEAKSQIASQLAASFARTTAEPVLIIDADLRSPSLHAIFDVSNEVGLADLLDQRCEAKDAIVNSWSPQLHIIPAGRLEKNPHALFRPEAIGTLLRELRADYRYIIIDTPPVLAAAETLTLAKNADGVLLSAMRDISRGPRVKLAQEQLLNVGAQVLGVVLCGVPVRTYENAYGSYHSARRYPEGQLLLPRNGSSNGNGTENVVDANR